MEGLGLLVEYLTLNATLASGRKELHDACCMARMNQCLNYRDRCLGTGRHEQRLGPRRRHHKLDRVR